MCWGQRVGCGIDFIRLPEDHRSSSRICFPPCPCSTQDTRRRGDGHLGNNVDSPVGCRPGNCCIHRCHLHRADVCDHRLTVSFPPPLDHAAVDTGLVIGACLDQPVFFTERKMLHPSVSALQVGFVSNGLWNIPQNTCLAEPMRKLPQTHSHSESGRPLSPSIPPGCSQCSP